MSKQHKDIELFRQLRKQLAGALSNENNNLMHRIEMMASGAGIEKKSPLPSFKKEKRLTHKQRVARHLKLV